ncbi:MAG: glycine--tRNA ligase subunit beta [Gammaproteobacteria bacterium]
MAAKLDFLVELGTEELPPKALRRLASAFAEGMRAGIAKCELPHGDIQYYATPRRMAVLVHELPESQPDRNMERRGPAIAAAFDDEGNPTKAAQGFARSCGVSVDQLERLENDQGAWLVYRSVQRGVATAELLAGIVEQSLVALPTPKRMRWGSLRVEFVRPVHWLVMLFGDAVIDAELYGVRSGRESRGHRYHHPGTINISEPRAYAPLLETEGHVLPDYAARKEAIRGQVAEAAKSAGGTAVIDEDLLEEVTALVEWPVALLGDFETRFLDLPPEPLISTMQGNQKYFPVVDAKGKLLPHFITVCNIDSHDPAQVRAGNERVIRPRFSDAAFFWGQDCRHPLEQRREGLKKVLFQAKLGTLYDKTERLRRVAGEIASRLGGNGDWAMQAAALAKCDLLTHMVGEFPEVQGIMGRYYALVEGLPDELAEALDEQYWPRFAGDRLPVTASGRALAIADRLDTLVGTFAIGQIPSGDKDPYALRRAALGVLRTMIECGLDLDLKDLIEHSAGAYPADLAATNVADQVFDFMMERLRSYYHESGTPPDVFDAVVAQRPTRPFDFEMRIRAVTAFRAMPEAKSLAAANKRIRNILKQAEENIPAEVDAAQLVEPAERALYRQLAALSDDVGPLFDAGDYTTALQRLAGLREAVDGFFDKVMVMTDEEKLRRNRLALLARLNGLFLRAADFSRLH